MEQATVMNLSMSRDRVQSPPRCNCFSSAGICTSQSLDHRLSNPPYHDPGIKVEQDVLCTQYSPSSVTQNWPATSNGNPPDCTSRYEQAKYSSGTSPMLSSPHVSRVLAAAPNSNAPWEDYSNSNNQPYIDSYKSHDMDMSSEHLLPPADVNPEILTPLNYTVTTGYTVVPNNTQNAKDSHPSPHVNRMLSAPEGHATIEGYSTYDSTGPHPIQRITRMMSAPAGHYGGEEEHSNSIDEMDTQESPSPNSGSERPMASRPHVLPPCKVCESPATGFHYGVNTCEACKGFFRRSLLRKQNYVCAKSTRCSIQKGKRNMCAACRYRRCLLAGMSKEGIKTGRYTYEKRTSDILELKRLHTEEARQRVLSRQEQLTQRYEELIAQIVKAQERNHTESMKTNPIIEEIHTTYLEKKKREADQSATAGSSSSSSSSSSQPQLATYDQYMSAYAETGVEIDDRRKVMETWISTAERGLKQMVSFAKDLPGFNELPLSDQIILLKNSIAEAWVITRHKAFNVDHACYSAHCGFTFDIHKVFDPDFVEVLLTVVRRLQLLELTYEETCVLKSITFFFSDRCDLEAPEKVDAMQFELVEVLSYQLAKNHPNQPYMLARVILVLTDLRTITEMYHQHNEKVLSWTDMRRAPLIWEVMSYSRTVHPPDPEAEDTAGTSTSTSKEAKEKLDKEN